MSGNNGFFSFLEERATSINSILCVGLDPHETDLKTFKSKHSDVAEDTEAAFLFCKDIVEKTKHVASAYKPNSAFFEALGDDGMKTLKRVLDCIPKEIPVVLDVKRGDISSTATAYAAAAYDKLGAHCVTLHPYMGFDSIGPFVGENASHGAFVLCKTSNPSSEDFETAKLADGTMLYESVAKKCAEWNKNNNIGLVVGATDVVALGKSRAAAPKLWILAPGVGFQAGNLEEAAKAGLREDGLGLLVPVSRGIARADDIKAAAESFRDQLNSVRESLRESASKKSKTEDIEELKEYQTNFINLALDCQVLRFGSIKLKSGRMSPYFFNAGLFFTGTAMDQLGRAYAERIVESKIEFDVVFGPAYKGISIAAAIVIALKRDFGIDKPWAYNRKEKKDHGEGGVLVGAPVNGKRILVVDDVITAGTAIRQSIDMLSKENASVIGVIVALDRQEKATDTSSESAIQAVKKEFGFDVFSIVGLDDLLAFLKKKGGEFDPSILADVQAYRTKYGVDYN